ncbi:fimbrial biogenesis outer membrane usher protein [Cupriavidus taiwanensis]|uniref:fimbria/pilus outer membrane usher protein n=1 Tax=Cupriavidus taiwanensis TaxID=164546 RepID=UPI000E176261|nr:fimbria/pilus outer membrane usher protein [Cupriavidus taiwanensis]SPA02309.1 fimbrial biogenesis outer membrane usher protein [Cupriavidus taiwanensis]
MKTKKTSSFPSRLRPASAVVLSLFASVNAWGAGGGAGASTMLAEVEFNDTFLQQPGGVRIDVSRFNKGNVALPGSYRAELYVNDVWLGRTEATLRQVGDDTRNVQPCFDRAGIERIGIDLSKLSPEASAKLVAGCVALPELVPDATASFDNGEQRLDVSVPQIAMSRTARGYVDPKYWDEGVTAARLQYNANVYHSDAGGFSTTQSYVGLNAGFNFGGWRFRHVGNLTHGDFEGSRYQSVQTSLQRSLAPIRSQLVIGEAYTDGALFDSFGFRGVQVASDDRMYPESQRGYAPVVRGIANSNARVQVRQSGNIIYETTVAPGAFEITDLYPTGYGGDLELVITEADGSVRTSRLPFAAAVNALRPGITRYSMTVGQYRNVALQSRPMMMQATVQHGISNMVTGYGGFIVAQDYTAVMGGGALNTDLGAFGADLTQAWTDLQNAGGRSGQSMRLSYSKLVAPTNTNLTLAAYRYSSSGYLSMADAMALRDLEQRGMAAGMFMGGIQRGRLQVTINQMLPQGYGSFYLTGSTQNYWNRSGSDTQFQAGYNNSYKRINYGISASRQFNVNAGKWDNRVMLTVGIPLGTGQHAPHSMTSLSHDSSGGTSLQQSVTGTLGDDNAFTYGVNAGYTGGGNSTDTATVGANVGYVSPFATVTASASKGRNYSQAGFGISGGIVAYAGGVAFTPMPGDTMAIVEAADAAGARVTNGSGLRVDPWGHAIVPSLTPFSTNQIEIDPRGLPISVALKTTQQNTAPTAGAIVKMKFETDNPGRAAILRVMGPDGEPLPFGAEVTDAQGQAAGTVGQGGRIIVRGLKQDSGELLVKWGSDATSSCALRYALPPETARPANPFAVLDAGCVTSATR